MSTENSHLAVQANIQSVTLAMKGDREGWLALYADDAVVKDPVGKSPFDASGRRPSRESGYRKILGYGHRPIQSDYQCSQAHSQRHTQLCSTSNSHQRYGQRKN
jgi:hypothetical protein